MSDYRRRRHTTAHKVGEFVHPDGSVWIIVEQPYGMAAVSDVEWGTCEPIDRKVHDDAVRSIIDERRRRADVEAYGIRISENSGELITHVTKTQIVTTSRRYKRSDGLEIGGSRYSRSKLPQSVIDEVERRTAGRTRWDFIAEGVKAAQSSSSLP